MALPDFILIGAMKCGTTTLAAQLAQQSGVFITKPKEPNFFSNDDVYGRGADWYRGLFESAAPGDLKGEASTHYTKLPTYPETITRMQALLPRIKLIYMIRDPMTRAVSQFIHEWSLGKMGSDAEAALASAPEIVDYGRYGYQITPFVEAYGQDAIFLTSLEQIKAEPEAEFARIAAFVGLENATWLHDLPAQNVSAKRSRKFPMQKVLIDNPVATALRQTLVPKSVRRWIREGRTMQERPEFSDRTKADMQARFLEDRAVLGEIFPGHPALTVCYPFA